MLLPPYFGEIWDQLGFLLQGFLVLSQIVQVLAFGFALGVDRFDDSWSIVFDNLDLLILNALSYDLARQLVKHLLAELLIKF